MVLRKCLADEFSSIHVFNLRGDARTSGEQRRKESGNVFGEGSRGTHSKLLIAVKNPAKKPGRIYYHVIGDYLSREEKLVRIKEFRKRLRNLRKEIPGRRLVPINTNDWIEQRDESFDKFISIGNKKDKNLGCCF